MRKRANPSAYCRFMRRLQSASTFLDSKSVDHTYRGRVDPSFCYFRANDTWREHTWEGILSFESAASLHICVPCKLVKQDQSKQSGNAQKKATCSLGEGPGACPSVTDGSLSFMSKGQVHPCGPDVVAWPHDLVCSLKTGPGIIPQFVYSRLTHQLTSPLLGLRDTHV